MAKQGKMEKEKEFGVGGVEKVQEWRKWKDRVLFVEWGKRRENGILNGEQEKVGGEDLNGRKREMKR